MKRMIILVSMAAVFNMAGVGYAMEDGLGVDVDMTWVSKYLWRGFDMLDDHAAFQPSVNVDLYQTGLNLGVWASIPGSGGPSGYTLSDGSSRGLGDSEEWRYIVSYTTPLFEGDPLKTDITVGWLYYDFESICSKERDAQEVFVKAAWPDLNLMGVVPHYLYAYLWGAKDDSPAASLNGAVHVLGLTYDYTCPDMPELPVQLSWDITYNNGQGGSSVDDDWSHMTWGLSTTMNCPMTGAKVRPAVYYQTSMEDTVNTEDELYAGMSYILSF